MTRITAIQTVQKNVFARRRQALLLAAYTRELANGSEIAATMLVKVLTK